MSRPLTYIAAPYSLGDCVANSANAMKMWDALASDGFTPFCPHWSIVQHLRTQRSYEFWISYCLEIVRRCDAVLRLPGESRGADMETEAAERWGIPVFHSLSALVAWRDSRPEPEVELLEIADCDLPVQHGCCGETHLSPFAAALEEIRELHDRKQKDYGRATDPFANVRASEAFGVPAWLGAVMRANDKMIRIQTFAQKGELANESVEDSIKDAATYFTIALVLYREATRSAD